jgi:hypothetical protein
MNTDLAHFQKFADEARARPSFEADYLDHNYKSGEWKCGRDKVISNGRQLGADIADLMIGWFKFDEENRRSTYILVRVDAGQPPKRRDELGDRDESRWNDGKDPWRFVRVLPLFDDETHESLIYTASSFGGYDAVAALTQAWIDNCKHHPEDADKVPLVGLADKEYTTKKAKPNTIRFLKF